MSELKNVHNLLESHKVRCKISFKRFLLYSCKLKEACSLVRIFLQINNPSYVRKSPVKEANNKPNETTVCARCKENEAYIESQREEIVFYKKKNKVHLKLRL